MMKVKIEKAIEMANNNISLKGIIISNLDESQVKVKDALLLSDHGIVIPEKNLFYDDNDVAYDPEFDDVEWDTKPIKMSWEEKSRLFISKKIEDEVDDSAMTISVNFKDKETREWARKNYDKLAGIVVGIIENMYRAYRIMK